MDLRNPPPVSTTGSGMGSLFLNDTRTDLEYDLTFAALSTAPTAGHFHVADSGRNGPVARPITPGGSQNGTTTGTWRSTDIAPLTPALVESVLTGRVYVNLHTPTHTGGEIRGQLRLTTGIGFTAGIDGTQEVPPVVTPATGTGSVVLTAGRDTVRFDITFQGLSANATAAHFHVGPQGVGGPVVKNLLTGRGRTSGTLSGIWTTSDVTQPLTRALADSLIAGSIYINIHTSAHPGGEIRGQVRYGSDLVTAIEPVIQGTPETFTLEQNFSDPFNPETSIRFAVPERAFVTLKVYPVIGQEVRTLVSSGLEPGTYSLRFDASGLGSGVYFYRMTAGAGLQETRKMIIIR